MAGRLTIIKSVLVIIPIYMLSTIEITHKMMTDLNKIFQKNLCIGQNDTHKFPLLVWYFTKNPKQARGVGIKHLITQDNALVAKLLWRMYKEPEALWNKILIKNI